MKLISFSSASPAWSFVVAITVRAAHWRRRQIASHQLLLHDCARCLI